MVRIIEKKSKSSCQSIQPGSKCSKTGKNYKSQSARYCRNPFQIFLQQFRNKEKTQKFGMSAYESSAVAGHLWQRMTDAEKSPYIRLAHQFNYIFQSRNRKVNWALRKIRQMMLDERLQLHRMWLLASKMVSWNERILSRVIGLDGDTTDDSDDEETEHFRND